MSEPRSSSDAPEPPLPGGVAPAASARAEPADVVPEPPEAAGTAVSLAEAATRGATTSVPPVPPEPPAGEASPAAAPPRDVTPVAIVVAFVACCAIALAAYVAINEGSFRSTGQAQVYGIAKMSVPRGTAKRDGDTLVVQAPVADVLIVSTPSDFRARDLASIDWDVEDVPAGADVRLLFTSDYRPRRVENRPLAVEDGRVQPIVLSGDRDWIGKITGLALAVRAPGATIRVRGVTAKPQTALQLVGDRAREWFRFEPWNGTSINAVTGGAQAQNLPLPVPVTIAALIALAALALVRRLAPARLPGTLASIAAGLFVLAWAVLDVRWTANLARQNVATIERYGGKDAAGRADAAEDGDLYRFIEKVRAALPADPQRIVVLSSAHYYRGRAGWHLLPHRVMWTPTVDAAPARDLLRPGDYVVVWQDSHAAFDAAAGRLRFDNGVDLAAKLVTGEGPHAVYAIL